MTEQPLSLIKIAHTNLARYFKHVNKEGKLSGFIPNNLARTICEIYKFKTLKDTEEVYRYNSKLGIWTADGEPLIKQTAKKILISEANTARINDTLNMVRYSTYIKRSDFDSDQHLLVVANGLLNLNNTKLLPFTPYPSFLTRIPVEYMPEWEFEYSRSKQFFEEVCTPTGVLQSQEVFGYCLYKEYCFQKGVMLIGEGSNGKSTWIGLLKAMLGRENVCAIPLQDLDTDRFAIARFYGKLANLYADIPDRILQQTGKFKMLTGGDTLDAQKKFKDYFGFVNHAKLIYSANKIPETRDLSPAFFRRWLIIQFPNVFREDDPKTDKNLLKKLAKPEELSALLNWALDGLKRLFKNQGFTAEPTAEDTKKEYLRRSSSVSAFVTDIVVIDYEESVTKDELYRTYVQYCRDNNRTDIKPHSWFSHDLIRYCPEAESYKPHGGKRSWKNIRLEEKRGVQTRFS